MNTVKDAREAADRIIAALKDQKRLALENDIEVLRDFFDAQESPEKAAASKRGRRSSGTR